MMRITLRIVCLLVGLYCAIGAGTTSASSTSAPPSGDDQQIAAERIVLMEPFQSRGGADQRRHRLAAGCPVVLLDRQRHGGRVGITVGGGGCGVRRGVERHDVCPRRLLGSAAVDVRHQRSASGGSGWPSRDPVVRGRRRWRGLLRGRRRERVRARRAHGGAQVETLPRKPRSERRGRARVVLARRLQRQGLRREIVASRCPMRPRERHGVGC